MLNMPSMSNKNKNHFSIYSAEIAKSIPEDSFGLIFGINTFAAMFLQSMLTLAVVTDAIGLELDIQQQFNVYACFYIALGLVYLIPIVYRLFKCICNCKPEDVEKEGVRSNEKIPAKSVL